MRKYIRFLVTFLSVAIFVVLELVILSSCGNENHKHIYGEWIITKEATVDETGSKERTCSDCGYKEIETIDKLNLYTIIWKDADGSILECDENVVEGTIPTYDGPTPTKKIDETYTYTFAGWDKEISKASKYETYTAIYYRNEIINYIVSFYDEDGTILSKQTYHYGDTIVDIPTPMKPSDETYTYEFSGWNKEIGLVTENVDYIAKYNANFIEYKLRIICNDGTEQNIKLHYNDNLKNSVNLSRKDYTFGGFFSNESLTEEIENMPSCDTTVYVWWEEETKPYYFGCNIGYNYVNIFGYIGNETNIILPKYIDNKRVTTIEDKAFIGHSELKSITIPDSIESIKGSAFYECYGLIEVINKSSLKIVKGNDNNGYVGYYALNIKKEGVSEIIKVNDYLFYTYNNCNYLIDYLGNDTTLGLPSNFNGESYTIYNSAFHNNSSFSWVSSLTSITIPNCVTSIGDRAFYNCNNLTTITLGNGVTSIGDGAFYGCSSLTSINVPDSVISIGSMAFTDCSNLQNITLSNNLISIGRYAFAECIELSDFTIPNSVTSIESYAFFNCSNITSIVIPNNLTSIESDVFSCCTKLTNLIISNGVTSIGQCSFWDCTSLTTIEIPDSVTTIESSAFYNCNLKAIYYKGKLSEWNEIFIGDGNYYSFEFATKYFLSETKPTDTTYNYWHYVDGVPTPWEG